MKFLDLFTHKHIHDVLEKSFSSYNDGEVLFSADKCKDNENFTVFKVKGNGIDQKYVLVKIPKISENQGQQHNNSKVACPVFVLEDKNKECYGAFENLHELEDFVPPAQNNAECLEIILKDLAEHQALELINSEVNKSDKWNLKDITDPVMCLDYFKDLDKAAVQKSLEDLQVALNELIGGSNFLVRSIWSPLAQNVYVNQYKTKSVFLNVSSTTIVPPAYDALMYIFSLSDEKFRQKNFENLVRYYFDLLIKFLQKLPSNLADKITKFYSEQQVKVLLPVVKFNIVSYYLKSKNSQNLQELLTNILYFLKYPLINQEDIYEIIQNKIGSTDYDLLNYSLVGLSEKNGHLGEYFHLDIKITTQGNKQELQLFAKFMKVSTDLMKEIVENGPAKKEDFFYKNLIPLFSKNGLDSLLDFAPRCYLSRANWLIVLDDLSRQGYVGLKPNSVLNYEGLKVTVKNLAKFHACTIVLEEILSDESGKIIRLDQNYGEFLEETMLIYDENHYLKPFYDATLDALYYIVEKFPDVTKKLNSSPEEIRARIKKIFLSLFSKVRKSDTVRNVINHGDMYVANMLFKFGKDKLITDGFLIDFQILRYAPPTYDLLFFLFANSTKETRDNHLKVLIEAYYQYISENIRKFNFDPELVFPKKAFDENIKFMTSAGIIGAFMYAHITHIDPDFREEIFHDQEKFDYYFNRHKIELIDLSWKNEHYKNVLKGIVEDVVDVIKKEY